MDAINNLLDKCKTMRNLPTDMALAKELKVGRAAVSGWRHGKSCPDPVACARISEITGEPLQRVLGIVGEARALSADEKKVWRRLAQVAAIAGVIVWYGTGTNAPLDALSAFVLAQPVGIMRSVALVALVIAWIVLRRSTGPEIETA